MRISDWSSDVCSSDLFGGRVVITLADGSVIEDEIAVADAHPLGARPFAREDYIRKFRLLAEPVLLPEEIERFLALAQRLPELTAEEVLQLTIVAQPGVPALAPAPKGLSCRRPACPPPPNPLHAPPPPPP